MMQSIPQRCGRMATENEQCHEDFISCKRGWRFYFTPQSSINLCLSSFQRKLSNINSLQSSFFTASIFDHPIEQCLTNQRDLKSALMTIGKLLKLDWPSFFFFMWLNLVTSTKLPTYSREGLSHHVVQQFFFFYDFFLSFLFNIFFLVRDWTQQKILSCLHTPFKGSSHHVVQQIFFLWVFFGSFLFNIFF